MIVISATVGIGFFVSSGEILATAGPAPTIMAFMVVGLVAWSAMDALAQMTMAWPVPSPIMEFPSRFVDKDLGLIVGFAYW